MNLKELVNPVSTVLLVIDKQAGYFNPALVSDRNQQLPPNSAETLELIDGFIEQARAAGVEVIWTRMVEDLDMSPMPIAEKIKHDPDGVTTISKPGSPSFEIYGRIIPTPDEKVITKYRYNAFSKTELPEYLNNKGTKTIILVGGYASRCILSTAAGANGEDLACVVPKGLVVNQLSSAHEVDTAYDIVNAIYGLAVNTDDITSTWQ